MKKKYQIASVAMIALTAASMSVPVVYAKTSTAVKNTTERMAGVHRGPFDETKMFEDQAFVLGISVDALKAKLATGKTFKDIIGELGLTEDQIKVKFEALRVKHQEELKALIQAEVASGKLTQAQADERIADIAKGPGEGRMMGFGKGRGPGMGMMGMGSSTAWGMKDDFRMLEDKASILGITVDDLKTRLDSGKTCEQIATDLGISADTLKTKMEVQRATRLAEMKAKIAQEVTDGKLTQAQADQMLERLTNPGKHGFGRGMGKGKSDRVERDGSRKSGVDSSNEFGGRHSRQNGFGSTSASQ